MKSVFVIYITESKWKGLFYLLWNILFGLVLYLSEVDVDIILYGFSLVTVFAAMYVGVGFYYFNKKSNQWKRLISCTDLQKELLPEATNHEENYLLGMIDRLIKEHSENISLWDQKNTELLDYYTLWTHQIKTPIAALHLLHQEQMKHLDLENPLRNSIKNSQQELFKIERYVESVIQFTQLESSTSHFRFEQVELDKIIRQVAKKYALLFIHLKLTLTYHPIDVTVLSDAKWLLFVIEQIISNALKYTPKGQIMIYWDVQTESLIIQDTGIGIQSEDLPRVFEKGFTGYNGLMDKKSTGIGLYLCKKIIKKLGHTIHISSQLGVGTSVLITF